MHTEIEAKLKVGSHKGIIERLTELGAEFQSEQLQIDCYFDTSENTLRSTDSCLRLRRQAAGGNEKAILTFKGPKAETSLKTRGEVELNIEDAEAAVRLLEALGYRKALVFEKKRRLWRLGVCEVALDELPLLGKFIEIEGPSEERIRDVQNKLRLSDVRHIAESYACLMDGKLKQSGTGEKEVRF